VKDHLLYLLFTKRAAPGHCPTPAYPCGTEIEFGRTEEIDASLRIFVCATTAIGCALKSLHPILLTALTAIKSSNCCILIWRRTLSSTDTERSLMTSQACSVKAVSLF